MPHSALKSFRVFNHEGEVRGGVEGKHHVRSAQGYEGETESALRVARVGAKLEFLQVGESVAVAVERGVVRIERIEIMRRLPIIGYPIAVGVGADGWPPRRRRAGDPI